MSSFLVSYCLVFSRLTIGFAFVLSSLDKVLNFAAFEQAVANYQILPRPLVKTSALLVLVGQVTVVTLLFLGGRFLTFGFSLAIALLFGFCIVLSSVLTRNLKIPCHCFSLTEKSVSLYTVLRSVGFFVCALVGWVARWMMPLGTQTSLSAVEFGFLGLMAVGFVVLWIHLSGIMEILSTF